MATPSNKENKLSEPSKEVKPGTPAKTETKENLETKKTDETKKEEAKTKEIPNKDEDSKKNEANPQPTLVNNQPQVSVKEEQKKEETKSAEITKTEKKDKKQQKEEILEEKKKEESKIEIRKPSPPKVNTELLVEDRSSVSQDIVNDVSNMTVSSIITILSGRKPEIQSAKRYSDFISDDLIDKLILKYNKTHSFTVVVFLSTYNTQLYEYSKGSIGAQDIMLKVDYSDDNWICNAIVTMINRLSRDPMRRVEPPEKLEGDLKKVMQEEMEKILSGKFWFEKYSNNDTSVIVQNIIDKVKFRFPNYFFSFNCIVRNDDTGFTSFSNNYCFYTKEDSTCFEIYNTSTDDLSKNSIFCTIYASFFKNK